MGNGYVQADGSAFQTMRDVITYSIAQVTLSEPVSYTHLTLPTILLV